MRTSLALILCLAALPAIAQPAGVTRVLRTIDFEERRYGNDEDLPMHWAKVEAPGFPHYISGHLATDRTHLGSGHAFRFDLNGGSLVYRYDYQQIKVRPGACYRVEGWAVTTPLQHARARITAYFTDLDGHPLSATLRHSELFASKAEDQDTWHRLDVELSAAPEGAGYLVVELGLLQPQMYAAATLGERTLHQQDIRGSAWFDDIAISQVPRVRVGTRRAGNIFRRSDPLSLVLEIDDSFTDDLAIQLTVNNAAGQPIYQRSGVADSPATSGAAQPAPAKLGHRDAVVGRRYDVPLPELTPGWFEVQIATSSQGQLLATRSVAIVRLPDDGMTSAPDGRFGVNATELPIRSWHKLSELLPHLGAGRVKLGVWTRGADAEQQAPADFDAAIFKLLEKKITPTACLIDLPPDLAHQLDGIQPATLAASTGETGTSWLRLLKANDAEWQPALEWLISRHANHLDRWQLGPDGSDAFATQKGMREVYSHVYAKFAQLLRSPDLAMPWPAWYDLDGNLPATVALSVPSSVLPTQLPLYLQDLKGAQDHHVSLSFQFLDPQRYGRDVRNRDLAQRLVYALAAGADRLDLPFPFTTRPDDEIPEGADSLQPTETFVILRSLAMSLANGRYAGRVPIAEGVEAFLFDHDGRGVLVMWDDGKEGERHSSGPAAGSLKPLSINLGASPRMLDLFGNEIPLLRPAIDDPATGTVQLVLGPTPVFLTNIDGALAQLRASVAIDQPLIESSFQTHTRHLKFKNTYPQPITGTVKLKGPAGWNVTPSTHNFSLNPGEEFDREIAIEFPYNSPAGSRTIQAEFALQSDRATSFHTPLTVKLGLSDVGMQTMALRDGSDVVIQQIIQNYGDKPVDYSAFAIFPGKTRQERLVMNLQPGRSVIKRFRFENVPENLPEGTKARVGLKEIDGPRILNDEIEIR